MARITVEDCLEKIDSQYDLVLLAKERTAQLNAGEKSLVEKENDKNTVISLREIGEGKISLKTLEESAINKLTKIKDEPKDDDDDLDVEHDDDFDKIYKGEISKSGAAILPSKRVRRMPEKSVAPEEDLSITPNEDSSEDLKEDLSKEEIVQETQVEPTPVDNKTE
jgi:DNA-directed RNA polymerase subunit omega|tara:strand:+ start:1195 stop:1692 length:498 start_codon:yes stop_codon:yes gene_type:complete